MHAVLGGDARSLIAAAALERSQKEEGASQKRAQGLGRIYPWSACSTALPTKHTESRNHWRAVPRCTSSIFSSPSIQPSKIRRSADSMARGASAAIRCGCACCSSKSWRRRSRMRMPVCDRIFGVRPMQRVRPLRTETSAAQICCLVGCYTSVSH